MSYQDLLKVSIFLFSQDSWQDCKSTLGYLNSIRILLCDWNDMKWKPWRFLSSQAKSSPDTTTCKVICTYTLTRSHSFASVGVLSHSKVCAVSYIFLTFISTGKEFSRYHNLQGHMHMHTNSKPYVCFCGTAFTLKGSFILGRERSLLHDS